MTERRARFDIALGKVCRINYKILNRFFLKNGKEMATISVSLPKSRNAECHQTA